MSDLRPALRRCDWLSATDQAAPRRQTVPDGPTFDAPYCVADQIQEKIRAGAERRLCLLPCSAGVLVGSAPRTTFRPSPHPRIRWTVASPSGA